MDGLAGLVAGASGCLVGSKEVCTVKANRIREIPT